MRRFKPGGDHDFADALANFALTFAKALMVFFVVLIVLIVPEKKAEDGIKPKVDYVLTASWPPGDNDVDIWMQDPDGKIMYFGNREAGVLNLERDDMGIRNNVIMVDGKEVVNDRHEEIVAIRGRYPGEYIVNVHLYRSGLVEAGMETPEPIPVTVQLVKMNPSVTPTWKGVVMLHEVKEEVHVFRFRITDDGTVVGMQTDLPTMLIEKLQNKPK